MKLVIISHTAHYKTTEGEIVGWGPTVTEINHLLPLFDKIYHCSFLHSEEPPKSSLPYTSSDIEFIPLTPSGGKGILQKLTVFSTLPETLKTIRSTLELADIFQFRAPTGIGIYLIPYLTYFERKKGWFKYAGNWNQKKSPPAYALQRWMLKKQSRRVTINGTWPDQPENIISFDNPCLTIADREKGLLAVQTKTLEGKPSICFVGNLTLEKGFDIFMDVLDQMTDHLEEIHVIGDGPLRSTYEKKCPSVIFHGYLPKEGVHDVYLNCHFIGLPSLSEGFPKVIAEGINFGCIPIVSDISGIGQIIKEEENGFLIKSITREGFKLALNKALKIKNNDYRNISEINYQLASRFTYDIYVQNLKSKVLNI